MKIFSKKLLSRILVVDWEQPLLTANGNYGTDEFAVYRDHSGGSFSGGDAWQAFATTSGYDGHWTGNYGDEYSTWLYLYMASKHPLLVTGYSCYYPYISSSSEGSVAEGNFQASNDNSNWVTLNTHGSYGINTTNTQTFTNTTYYKYYRYNVRTHGNAYHDLMTVSSFRLQAKYEDFV